MRVADLAEINQLDQTIASMHQQLSSLYQQRLELLGNEPQLPTGSQTLEHTAQRWQQYGINLPTSQAFKAKYNRAQVLIERLEGFDDRLKDQLHIVVVPPTAKLRAALASNPRYACLEQELCSGLAAQRSWNFAVISDISWRVPVYGLDHFVAEQGTIWVGEQADAMTLATLLSADVQGIQVVQPGANTILLPHTQTDNGGVLCASSDNAVITIDVEDTNCLLGANYLHPTIHIN